MKVGNCHECNQDVYLDKDGNTIDGDLPAGDWDWICYPCQFKLMDSGQWDSWKTNQLSQHNESGKCNH